MTDERPASKHPWFAMNPYRRAIGLVLVVVGGVWFLQGIGVAQGSVMTGSTLWAFLGAAFFAAGVVVLARGRRPPVADDEPEPEDPSGERGDVV